jgi:hypothetical protein
MRSTSRSLSIVLFCGDAEDLCFFPFGRNAFDFLLKESHRSYSLKIIVAPTSMDITTNRIGSILFRLSVLGRNNGNERRKRR